MGTFSKSTDPRGEPRFLVDFMLGRLAKWLLVFGFDTEYITENERQRLVLRSLKESRILLTRDNRLSRKRAWKLVLIRADRREDQLRQLITELKLTLSRDRLFTRCTECNVPIVPVTDREAVRDLVPPYVFETQTLFTCCPGCRKVFWQGTHLDLMRRELEKAGLAKLLVSK